MSICSTLHAKRIAVHVHVGLYTGLHIYNYSCTSGPRQGQLCMCVDLGLASKAILTSSVQFVVQVQLKLIALKC